MTSTPATTQAALRARVAAMRRHQRLYAERMRLAREHTAELLSRLRAQGALPAPGGAICQPDKAGSGIDLQHPDACREVRS